MKNRGLILLGAICTLQLVGVSPASADDPTPGGVTYEDAAIDDGCTAGEPSGDLEHGGAVLGLASIALALALRTRRPGHPSSALAVAA
jgi:hypothetical protein